MRMVTAGFGDWRHRGCQRRLSSKIRWPGTDRSDATFAEVGRPAVGKELVLEAAAVEVPAAPTDLRAVVQEPWSSSAVVAAGMVLVLVQVQVLAAVAAADPSSWDLAAAGEEKEQEQERRIHQTDSCPPCSCPCPCPCPCQWAAEAAAVAWQAGSWT